MKAFVLLRRMPGLEQGAVFVHDAKNESNLGSPRHGCLILAWDAGGCQGSWCGATFVLPGQLAKDDSWFEEVDNPNVENVGHRPPSPRYYITIKKRTYTEIQ